jgi:hypothetical protein
MPALHRRKQAEKESEMSEYTLVKQKYDEWVKAQEGWRAAAVIDAYKFSVKEEINERNSK